MDRMISKEEISRRRRKRLAVAAGALALGMALVALAAEWLEPTVKEADLRFGRADVGTLETSINATGKVVPAFEEIINSPIASRVVEVYCKAGDSVVAGTPLLRLDLQSTETEMRRLADEHAIKQYSIEQNRVQAQTAIANLEMQVKVKEMSVSQLREDVGNERRLDSLGSGTGERIRQAQLAYDTALLELEQLRQQLANERNVQQSAAAMKQLELSISAGNIALMQRTIDDARLKAPRAATLTFIVNEIGRQVGAGERVAVIADLKHFKVEGQIADSYAPRLAVGAQAMVLCGKDRLAGTITNVSPQSQGGVIDFTVTLADDDNAHLRSGLSTQVHVLTDIKPDATRIPFGPYYAGAGEYDIFVREGDAIVQRTVRLGQASYDYVEVLSGIAPGEEVVVADMKPYASRKHLKLK